MKKEIVCRVWTKEGWRDLTKEQWFNFDTTKLHRLDGPAAEWPDGTKWWYVDRKLHRLDGPAIERENGTRRWYINDKELPIDEVETWIKENNIDLTTQKGQMAFKLRWM